MNPKNARRLYLHAITPLHAGIGQSGGVVDLPIAREKATGWPVVPGSSLKGSLLSGLSEHAKKELGGSQESAGPISFTDLRILCLPVRSFYGTFAWVTSPLVLERFARDGAALGLPVLWPAATVSVTGTSAVVGSDSAVENSGSVYLEDINLRVDATQNGNLDAIASALRSEVFGNEESTFERRFAVVSDSVFDFLCETATEVAARIAINEHGTTSGNGGNLWYEESAPAESIFAGWAVETGFTERSLASAWESIAGEPVIQIGGNATVGRGLCRMVVKP